MRLKNKETGEIVEVITGDTFEVGGIQIRSLKRNPQIVRHYPSLAELNAEWCDAPEEPKEYWYINEFGTPTKADFVGRETLYDKCRKNFGNYFEAEEEAELAVRKLKAWKRLKDKGFRFRKWDWLPDQNIICGNIGFYIKDYDVDTDDLGLLFGGENER